MSFGKMLKLAFSRTCPKRRRVLALINVLGVCYFLLMVTVTTYLTLVHILPLAYGHSVVLYYGNRIAVYYLLANVLGNYISAYTADCSVRSVRTTELNSSSWFTCKRCRDRVPERSHHCSLCDVCIVKREHHCFLFAKCIGYQNERYFTVFLFYVLASGFYATVLLAKYVHMLYGVRFANVLSLATVLPQSLRCWVAGTSLHRQDNTVTSYQVLLTSLLYGCLGGALAAGGFLGWQVSLVFGGQTTYEARKDIRRFSRSAWENYRSVFGRRWLAVWFLPIGSPPEGEEGGVLTTKLRRLRSRNNNVMPAAKCRRK